MPKAIICIVGLPGSGKTHLGNLIVGDGILLDDLNDPALFDAAIVLSDRIVITDPHFVRTVVRETAGTYFSKYGEVTWIFFENNPEKCLRNIEFRNDGRKVGEFIKTMSNSYYIHALADVRQIWTPK